MTKNITYFTVRYETWHCEMQSGIKFISLEQLEVRFNKI